MKKFIIQGGGGMTAKEYLSQLRRLNVVINNKIKELDELRAMSGCVSGIDYSTDKVQVSPQAGGSFENIIERIIILGQDINKEIDDYVDIKHKIINQINGLNDYRYVEVLYKKYVEFKRFEEVAVDMNYTYQYTIELHGYALNNFYKTYKNLLNSI